MNMNDLSSPYKLQNHYVICNWSDKVEAILTELNARIAGLQRRATVIVTTKPIEEGMLPTDPEQRQCFEDVMFYPGEPSKGDVLRLVNFHDAECVIILALPELGNQADARTLLTLFSMLGSSGDGKGKAQDIREALKARRKNSKPLHVVAEVVDVSSYSKFKHFEDDPDVVVEIIRAESVRTRVMAQAAYTHGLAQFYQDLMSYGEDTNEVYAARIPDSWLVSVEHQEKTPTFSELYKSFMDPKVHQQGVSGIPVGIWRPPNDHDEDEFSGTLVNPPEDFILQPGDHVMIICRNREQAIKIENELKFS